MVGGDDEAGTGESGGLDASAVDGEITSACGACECEVHGARAAMSGDCAGVGGPGGRADIGDIIWRPEGDDGAVGAGGFVVAAWGVFRIDHGVGDDGGGGGKDGNVAAGSDGDVAVLWVPHG